MACKRSNAMRVATTPSISDNFTLIEGVGPRYAARLHDAGIYTFAQLAMLSPEDLAARISGLSTKRIIREKWIKQAQKLAERAARKSSHRIRQRYATFTVELLLGSDDSVRRTRVRYIQNKTEESWAGWEEQKLAAFLRTCAGLSEPLPPPTHSLAPDLQPEKTQKPMVPKPAPHVKPKSNMSGTLQVGDLVTLAAESDIPQSIVRANERFRVRFVLDLTQVKAASSSFHYRATIWAKKLGMGVREIVGTAQGIFLPAEKIPCHMEAVIQSQGTYRLEAIVTLTPASTIPSAHSTLKAWIESRFFQVC